MQNRDGKVKYPILKVRDLALELDYDETRRFTCPKCGIQDGFAVTRKDTHALYMCHRASCDFKGSVSMYLLEHMPIKNKPLEPIKGKPVLAPKMDFDFEPLPQSAIKFLVGHYSFTQEEIEMADWKWMTKENRLWMPIVRRDGTTSGGVARSFTGEKPKTINYLWSTNGPVASYARNEQGYEGYYGEQFACWLVEDQISAQRLMKYGDACALLGTNVSDKLLVELTQHYDEVILALDPDAMVKALKLQKMMNPHITTRVVKLTRDIKNMTRADLSQLVYRTGDAMVGGH